MISVGCAGEGRHEFAVAGVGLVLVEHGEQAADGFAVAAGEQLIERAVAGEGVAGAALAAVHGFAGGPVGAGVLIQAKACAAR